MLPDLLNQCGQTEQNEIITFHVLTEKIHNILSADSKKKRTLEINNWLNLLSVIFPHSTRSCSTVWKHVTSSNIKLYPHNLLALHSRRTLFFKKGLLRMSWLWELEINSRGHLFPKKEHWVSAGALKAGENCLSGMVCSVLSSYNVGYVGQRWLLKSLITSKTLGFTYFCHTTNILSIHDLNEDHLSFIRKIKIHFCKNKQNHKKGS